MAAALQQACTPGFQSRHYRLQSTQAALSSWLSVTPSRVGRTGSRFLGHGRVHLVALRTTLEGRSLHRFQAVATAGGPREDSTSDSRIGSSRASGLQARSYLRRSSGLSIRRPVLARLDRNRRGIESDDIDDDDEEQEEGADDDRTFRERLMRNTVEDEVRNNIRACTVLASLA